MHVGVTFAKQTCGNAWKGKLGWFRNLAVKATGLFGKNGMHKN